MKKKKFVTLFCLPFLVGLIACNGNPPEVPPIVDPTPDPDPEPTPDPEPAKGMDSDVDYPTEIPAMETPAVEIHYQRHSGTYQDWALWMWADGADGAEYLFEYQDDYGIIAYVPLSKFGGELNIGFIIKKSFASVGENVWQKDENGDDRKFELEAFTPDEKGVYHVYVTDTDAAIYEDSSRSSIPVAITNCQFSKMNTIKVVGNRKITKVEYFKDGTLFATDEPSKAKSMFEHKLPNEEDMELNSIYSVKAHFENGQIKSQRVAISNIYNKAFDEANAYDGELGAIYTKTKTEFKVWSPISSRITLRLFTSGDPSETESSLYREVELEKGEKGVFSTAIEEDLAGKYYTYVVYNAYYPLGQEIVDPYAKSTGVNGLRGQVVDFSETNPEDWDDVSYLQNDPKSLAVYETHIADLTSSDTWGGNPELAKTFNGFRQEGTRYHENIKTGFDHIKELGVNAVQLIPIYDQANDEVNTSFNWGYNPLNYNALEGSYSSNPYDGYVKIKEFKELVKAYNEAGIEIIMDVVYNHTNSVNGLSFDVLMPYYYYRYTSTKDTPMNGSGCGNETASDHQMFRKFMIDSAKFWMEEYKLGGFRFDLMGLHDIDTMNELSAAVKEINPNAAVYGEPWTGGTSGLASSKQAKQDNLNKLTGVGAFNDQIRNGLVGGPFNAKETGWATNNKTAMDVSAIKRGLMGKTTTAITDPNKAVNYVTCHDNYTIHDRARIAGITDEAEIAKMSTMANSIVFFSQGTSFMLAGEEMLRSKVEYDKDGNPTGEYSGNSYMSSYKTNELDYSKKEEYPTLFKNYQDMIYNKTHQPVLHHDTNIDDYMTVESSRDGSKIVVKYNFPGKDPIAAYFTNGLYDESLGETVEIDGEVDAICYSTELNEGRDPEQLKKYTALVVTRRPQ